MNKAILIGNLVADPSANTTNSGKAVSNFRIAVQREFSNQQGVREADFFNVIAYEKTADFVNSYMVKGRKVAVEGRIQIRSYDANDGTKRWVTDIIAQRVEALGGRENAAEKPADAPNESGQFTEVVDPENPF